MSTHLETVKIGAAFHVVRIDSDKPDDFDRLPGIHKSKRAANTAARTIGTQTGEALVASKAWR